MVGGVGYKDFIGVSVTGSDKEVYTGDVRIEGGSINYRLNSK